MKSTLIILLALAASYVAASFVIQAISSFGLYEDPLVDSFSMFINYTGTFVLTAILLVCWGKSQQWEIPSLRPRLEKLNLPLIVLALLTMLAIGVLADPLLNLMPEVDLIELYDMMGGGLWAVMTGVVVAPIIEEFIFRGIVQRNIARATTPWIGIIITSLIFGAIHLIPQQILLATLNSVVLGVVFYLTRSLISVVVIHLLNNGLAYINLIYFGQNTDLTELVRDNSIFFAIGYAICALFVASLLAIAIIRIGKLHRTKIANQSVADISK